VSQRVLIIDDSDDIHALIRARLAADASQRAIEITSAPDGASGLECARNHPPDLILLDVDMPDLNGFEVCRQLKFDPRTRDVPIIFLTGAASTEQKILGLELGAVDYVTKPFDPAELRARVRSSLRTKYLMDLLARKAQIDGLTGLWNRQYFDRRLSDELSLAIRHARPLACLLADIDHFKSCNDRFGHSFGDEVIRRVAMCLAEAARAEDVVCRYGGEEFAIIAPSTDSVGAADLAERLRVAVAQLSFAVAGRTFAVTASVGVAATDCTSDLSIVELADRAMYRAKSEGRNRVATASATPSAAVLRPSA
jgi:diguanylate cyclase (GGDEF)-like protein